MKRTLSAMNEFFQRLSLARVWDGLSYLLTHIDPGGGYYRPPPP